MDAVVRQLMELARIRVGKDAELVAKIAPLVGRKYAPASVSGWRRGHDRMPAAVLLACCQVTGVSIDELLFGEALVNRQDRLEREVEALRKTIESQRIVTISQPADLG